jgi:predicted NBD/HSP70 family sugar kinase
MKRTLGVVVTRHIWLGTVVDHELSDTHVYPSPGKGLWDIRSTPPDQVADTIREQIARVIQDQPVEAIGLGFPGIMLDGVVQECPNYPQMKGYNLAAAITDKVPVTVVNRTDGMAAGIAATRGQLERLIRVWYLADGIGFGRYPRSDGIWEGGHMVVSLDPKERFCGCGGIGHLESIMGNRAMRLRFLDMEPDEVFANAKSGDPRCVEFVNLWHRALAAASATSIHLDGPGKFFVLGPNAEFFDARLLNQYLHEMVTMSSLQNSQFETLEGSREVAMIGAAVRAEQAGSPQASR